MNFSDEDSEILIELIRKHPPLYNAQLDSFRDENLKDNIWKSIALSLNKTDSECRKKWKLIRDSYNRYKRRQKQSTGSPAAAKNSKWQLYECLRFLETTTPSERQSCINEVLEKQVTNDHPGVEYEDTPHEDEEFELPGTSKFTQERSNIPLSVSSEKSTAENTKRKRQEEDEFIKFMKDKQENQNRQLESIKSQESVDDISTFTKHIEMVLRKLSACSRAMAKNEIFNILSKYEIGDIEGQTFRPYTSSTPYFPTISASSTPQAQSDSPCLSSYNSNSYSPMSAVSSEHQHRLDYQIFRQIKNL